MSIKNARLNCAIFPWVSIVNTLRYHVHWLFLFRREAYMYRPTAHSIRKFTSLRYIGACLNCMGKRDNNACHHAMAPSIVD